MKDESTVEAIERIMMTQFNIKPTIFQVMLLADAVDQTRLPPSDVTITSLRAILRSLTPHHGLHAWASTCAEEITKMIAGHDEVLQIARARGEGFWCSLEGVLSAMLKRAARGLDLDGKTEDA